MHDSPILEKAERIRDVIRYLKKFKNATVVIYLDDEIIDSPLFVSHIRDIALIHEAGLRVILVPGARKKIDEYLSKNEISWTYENGIRITTSEAMPLIKNAAFDAANGIIRRTLKKVNPIEGNNIEFTTNKRQQTCRGPVKKREPEPLFPFSVS